MNSCEAFGHSSHPAHANCTLHTHIKKTQLTASVCTKICHFSSKISQNWPLYVKKLYFLAIKFHYLALISVFCVQVVSWCS